MSATGDLRARVRARRRRWLVARALELALLAGGVAAATLAAQRLSGPAEPAPALVAAGLCALLAAALCARERWRDEARYTRRLDARVGADGALATACELARRGARDPLLELLAAQTGARLARSGWRGAGAPPSPLFLAALLGGLALLAGVGPGRAGATLRELEAALGSLEALASDAGEAQIARALERLDGALAAVAPAPARARELERRRAAALARLEAGASGPARPGAGQAALAESAGGPAPGPGGAARGGSGQATLAAGAGDRTMSRPDGPPPMQRESRTPSSSAAGAAPARAATWPRRHDAVVAGYLERRPRD